MQAGNATVMPKTRGSHTGRKLKLEGTRMACPHCEAQAEIRTSRLLSNTMRELIYVCTNVECGHTFVAMTEIVRTLSPSATPNPKVLLPLSTHVQRDMVKAVMDSAGHSHHQAQYTPPATGDLFCSATPPQAANTS